MYRKNTASQFFCFQGVDATTGGIKSGVTWTIRRCIDGTFAAATGTVSEDGTTGFYKMALSQADTNGNDISFNFTGSGAVPQTVNIVTTACDPTVATNFGITGIPAVASGSAGALLIDGTGTAAISNSSGKVLLQATQSGVTIPTVTTVTNQLTAAAIATGVWTDTTAGDFTTALSVGKSVMNGVTLGTGLTVASVSGAVGSVTGAVGSVTGAVGSVTGAVGSVTARVTANTDQLAGQTVTAAAGVTFPASVASPTNITAGTITTATNVTTVNGLASGVITDASFAAGTGKKVVRASTATAGAASTITLDASASATDSIYNGCLVYLTGGTGIGQSRTITGYVGSTQVATVDRAWQTNPDNTSTFAILPADGAKLDSSLKVAGVVLVDTLTTYTGNTVQTGDSFARIGATGSGLTSLAPSATALSTVQWTNTLATNLGTLAGHDPGATLGTSTLTQTQVTGGAYALNSASFAWNAALDLSSTQKTSVTAATPTAAAIAGATWDVTLAGHVTAGSTGAALNAASAAGDPWAIALPGAYGAGTAGQILGDKIMASVTGAVGSVTGNVGGDVVGSVGSVVGAVGSVTANVNADIKKVNGVTVNGAGTSVSPWGP